MQKPKTKNFRFYLKWFSWIVVAQIVLVNISASIYAYKFTHFYNAPAPNVSSQNIINKTWKLFAGPKFYKNINEPEPSFAYKTVTLKTSEGIPIDTWYSRSDSSKGCVILIHGYSVNKTYVEAEAAVFKQWGYSVLLFDLRGHGKSGGNNTSFGMKETDELTRAFDFAKRQGHSKIILYGVSLGAGICMKATAEEKIHPDAIIADVPFENLHQHFKARARILGFPPEPFAALTTFWIGVEKGYNGFRNNTRVYAQKISCPVLMEWGTRDQFVTRQETENIFSHLSSKNKKLVIYPDADHGSFLEHDAATWQREVQAFLKSVD